MGRKSHSKQGSKKNVGGENKKNLIQKRKELAVLVEKLRRLTSVFQPSTNMAKNWDHHLEIEKIIKEVRNIESYQSKSTVPRKAFIENYLKWLVENEVQFEGIELTEFEGFELGLKATKEFLEGSLILSVPTKAMMTEINAKESDLAEFIAIDPLLQNMPNITLSLFLLLERYNPDSFWKPYIDVLPQKYSTILFFESEELITLKPSPVLETSLKLYRSIARQYAYYYNKIHTNNTPVMKKFQEIFTYENYRWAVSAVMTRQNNIPLGNGEITAFIPLWDMCNHAHGKITTDFNKEQNRSECYAVRDFHPGEQIFIFYGARPNADMFLHNGFVDPNNQYDSVVLTLGVSSSDPLKDIRLFILGKLGLANVTRYNLYKGDNPVGPELLAFIRVFNMNEEELTKWSHQNLPGDLVSPDEANASVVGTSIDRRAYTYLETRCRLILASYKKESDTAEPDNVHRQTVKMLKHLEVQMLENAINYLEKVIRELPAVEKQ